MTAIGPAGLATAMQRIRIRFGQAETELNAADARLGDGDTGTMLKRLTEQLGASEIAGLPDVSAAFQVLAMAAAGSTGSSLGTLVATALIVFARETKAAPVLEPARLGPLLDLAIAAMSARGGAKPGDKTIIDGLLAVASAIATAPDEQHLPQLAHAAAQQALDRFRDEPNRIGRAGRYGEKSRGRDDPGMLGLVILCDALASQETS